MARHYLVSHLIRSALIGGAIGLMLGLAPVASLLGDGWKNGSPICSYWRTRRRGAPVAVYIKN